MDVLARRAAPGGLGLAVSQDPAGGDSVLTGRWARSEDRASAPKAVHGPLRGTRETITDWKNSGGGWWRWLHKCECA